MQSVPSYQSTNGAFGYRSVSDAAKQMRSARGAKRLQGTLWEVAKGSLACAAGAGLAMVAGVSAVPTFLFFIIEFFFLLACYVFVSRAQDNARYSNDQRRGWLNKARGMFLGLCFTMGYGLSPMLSLMNVILGPQNILLALLATFLVLAVTSMLAFLCFEKQQGQEFVRGFAPQVCWVLLALLLVGAVISLMPHVSAAFMVYSALSAVAFSLILFFDIIKHLYLSEKDCPYKPDSEEWKIFQEAQNIHASVGIFLDALNIFMDLLTFWATLKDKNKPPNLSSAFKSLIGVVLSMGVIAMLIAWACSGSSGSQSESDQPLPDGHRSQSDSSFSVNASRESVAHVAMPSSVYAGGTFAAPLPVARAVPVAEPMAMGRSVDAVQSPVHVSASPVAQAILVVDEPMPMYRSVGAA